jgi:hypothetical protein
MLVNKYGFRKILAIHLTAQRITYSYFLAFYLKQRRFVVIFEAERRQGM